MKKFLIVLVSVFLCGACFAAESKDRGFFGVQFALGSGYPFYGDPVVRNNQEKFSSDKLSRFILYSDFDITLKLADPIIFVTGVESMMDFNWNADYHCNRLDFAVLAGIQVYPGWGNLSFILSYALGCRGDSTKLSGKYKGTDEPKWGNGFRLAAEYDFKKGGGLVPGAGIAWRFMPRGYDTYDNILAIYLRIAFR